MGFIVTSSRYQLSFALTTAGVQVELRNSTNLLIATIPIPAQMGDKGLQQVYLGILKHIGNDPTGTHHANALLRELRRKITEAREIIACFGAVALASDSTESKPDEFVSEFTEQLATDFFFEVGFRRDEDSRLTGWHFRISRTANKREVTTITVDVVDSMFLEKLRKTLWEYCNSEQHLKRIVEKFIHWLSEQPEDVQRLVSSNLLRSEA